MHEFTFQMNYDEQSYTVMGYKGDEVNIRIPETFGGKPVTILYDKLFAGHKEVCSIYTPDSVTDFGEFLFDGCENLVYLRIPSSLRFLWGYSFVRCGLEEIVLPDGVSTISPYAFKDCRKLRKVVCGSGMKKIHSWAFGGCDQLNEVVCKDDVDISPDAFEPNTSILRIM